jgi:hypothetical protein
LLTFPEIIPTLAYFPVPENLKVFRYRYLWVKKLMVLGEILI